ncbi:MAG: C39 family peptidase [Pseudomonadota bacterium]
MVIATRTSRRDSVLRAPDGMEINAPSTRPAQPLSRAEIIAHAKKADVPQREQQGPTCGLYALGMVMDFWHGKEASCAAPLVSNADLGGKGRHYNFDPTTDERILDYAEGAGFTSQGEMFTARQLGQTAAHFGYQASLHDNASLDDLYRVLDAGHPAIVAFDVDRNGNPGDFGGQRAHYAVIEGYFDQDGERYLVAKHGWAVQKDHVWRAADFERSFNALHTTDYYGTPGDGVIPREPGLREPDHLDLPDAGGGRARIERSLNAKIVEVVPPGDTVVGGVICAAQD